MNIELVKQITNTFVKKLQEIDESIEAEKNKDLKRFKLEKIEKLKNMILLEENSLEEELGNFKDSLASHEKEYERIKERTVRDLVNEYTHKLNEVLINNNTNVNTFTTSQNMDSSVSVNVLDNSSNSREDVLPTDNLESTNNTQSANNNMSEMSNQSTYNSEKEDTQSFPETKELDDWINEVKEKLVVNNSK